MSQADTPSPENQTGKQTLIWGLVLAGLLIAGYLFQYFMEDIRLAKISHSADIETVIHDLSIQAQDYLLLTERFQSINDIWGITAIILAAAGSAAVLLRAPQLIIVLIAATVGIGYGAIQLYTPEAVVAGVKLAQSRVACLTPIAQSLQPVMLVADSRIDDARDHIDKLITDMDEKSIGLASYRKRVLVQQAVNEEQQQAALKALDQVLAIPLRDHSDAVDDLRESQQQLSEIRHELGPGKSTTRVLSRISQQLNLLQTAITDLSNPQALLNGIEMKVNRYLQQQDRTELVLLEGDRVMARLSEISSPLPGLLQRLHHWKTARNSVAKEIRSAVTATDSELRRLVGDSGITLTKVQKVAQRVATITIEPETAQTLLSSSRLTTEPQLSLGSLEQKSQYSTEQLIQRASRQLLIAQQKLDRYQQQLAAVRQVYDKIETVETVHLPIIETARQRIEKATNYFQDSIASAKLLLKQSAASLQQIYGIDGMINFDQTSRKIRLCMNSSSLNLNAE